MLLENNTLFQKSFNFHFIKLIQNQNQFLIYPVMLTFHIKELLQMSNWKAKVFPETGHVEFTFSCKRREKSNQEELRWVTKGNLTYMWKKTKVIKTALITAGRVRLHCLSGSSHVDCHGSIQIFQSVLFKLYRFVSAYQIRLDLGKM